MGTSIGFFAATFFLLRMGKEEILPLLLWVVFFFWQMIPILVEGYSPGLNFSEIARYPVSFRLYFLLNTAYGLLDPAAITGVLWLTAIWLAIVGTHPEWMLTAAGLFVIFAVFNVLCNRVIISIFERFQSTRKGRERVAAVMLLLMLVPQLFQFVVNGWIDWRRYRPPAWAGEAFSRLHQVSPPGQVFQALTATGVQSLGPFLVLLAWLLAFAWVLARRLRQVYLGEIHAESFTVKRELKVNPGWRLPGMDDTISAVFEKELRYLRQNSRLLVQLVYPVLLFGIIALGGPKRRGVHSAFPFAKGEALLAIFGVMMGLAVSNLSYNTFGMDREGFGRWLLSPLSLHKVLVAKNLAQGAVITVLYLALALLIMNATHVSWEMFLATTAGFLCVLIIQIAAGNVISVHWPKRIELTKMSSRTSSGAAGFMALGFTLPLIAIIGLVVFASSYWKLTWLPLAAGVLGLGLALALYWRLVKRAVSYASDHLEEIAKELGA
ncbi:MAG TPA: hypothetical protein VFL42_13880 [Terriglobales bacterium]|nr:hypothetical protein [Terriglobales bacterium]